MGRALAVVLPGVGRELQDDPVRALQARRELTVKLVEEREYGTGCSVSGAYHEAAAGRPAALAIGRSLSAGRRAFTALHELGHHIQLNDIDLAGALFAPGVDSHSLEEAACDTFAADLLLPHDVVAEHIGAKGPTADEVAGLICATTASRSAACVRAAQLLPSPGHVVLLKSDGAVFFAASAGAPPLQRDRVQTDPFVRQALAAATHQRQGTVRWTYRDGIVGGEMYAQSADVGGLIVIVAVVNSAPWEAFSPPSREDGPRARSRICVRCDEETSSFEPPCTRCGVPQCHSCRACECQVAVKERKCPTCWMVRPVRMYVGASAVCTECS
jgi:hypothetical protein